MLAPGASIVVQTHRTSAGYILIPCTIGVSYGLDMMLATTRPLSYLSVDAADAIRLHGHLDHIGRDIYRIREVRIAGQTLPDVVARISAGPGLLGVDGMLGLHFLKQFSLVQFERDTGFLTLTF